MSCIYEADYFILDWCCARFLFDWRNTSISSVKICWCFSCWKFHQLWEAKGRFMWVFNHWVYRKRPWISTVTQQQGRDERTVRTRTWYEWSVGWKTASWRYVDFLRGVAAWRSGNVVGRINEVTLRRARLVLGWVTCPGLTPRGGTFFCM